VKRGCQRKTFPPSDVRETVSNQTKKNLENPGERRDRKKKQNRQDFVGGGVKTGKSVRWERSQQQFVLNDKNSSSRIEGGG